MGKITKTIVAVAIIGGAWIYFKNKKKVVKKEEVKKTVITPSKKNNNLREICIEILIRENPPRSKEEFLRELVQETYQNEKLIEKVPTTVDGLEELLSDFKLYREYFRICISKLPKVIIGDDKEIIIGKV